MTSVFHWFTMTSIVIDIFPKVVLMLVNCLLALNVLPVVNIVMCNINVRKIAYTCNSKSNVSEVFEFFNFI